MNLNGQVSIVTGASRGIGRAGACMLARRGARVALGGRDQDALEETGRLVAAAGGEFRLCHLDVTDEDSVRAAIEGIMSSWGRIDHLINNAGVTRDGLLIRAREKDWQAVMDTNLGGLFRMTRRVLPIMLRARSGRIVNLGSVIGETGNPGQTGYAASKAGIMGFTKSLAREVASRSITVNCVAPGFIDTDMTRSMGEKARADLLRRIPLGRAGTPEDVARSICFLVSDDAAYITGAVLRVNGGLHM
ncbi:MAG: 3-oxoacyl-[acyl-carrier-protein] reductase [Acidobacteriota bacterium]